MLSIREGVEREKTRGRGFLADVYHIQHIDNHCLEELKMQPFSTIVYFTLFYMPIRVLLIRCQNRVSNIRHVGLLIGRKESERLFGVDMHTL